MRGKNNVSTNLNQNVNYQKYTLNNIFCNFERNIYAFLSNLFSNMRKCGS